MRTQELKSSSVRSEDKTTKLVGPKIMQVFGPHSMNWDPAQSEGRDRAGTVAWNYAAAFRAQISPKVQNMGRDQRKVHRMEKAIVLSLRHV